MKYILATFFIIGTVMAQDYYKMTDVDVIEIKTIPAAALMESAANGNYFDHSGDLFRPLFKYLQSSELTMTAPVEADIQKGKMRFFVEKSKKDDSLSGNDEVKVIRRPDRTVLCIGIRGSYSNSNFEEGLAKLNKWLNNNKGLRKVGDPIAVYWNSPFNLWFMKRSEVQIPVEKIQ